MATIDGTIDGVTLVRANGARKTYLLSCSFAAYTGASDDARLVGVGAAIAARTRNGKTNTLVAGSPACSAGAGKDTNNQDVYFGGTIAKSTDNLTTNLCNAAGTELTASTACKGVELVVAVDES